MASLSWNVLLGLMITISPVTYGVLTHVIEDTTDVNVFEEHERQKEIKEKALEKLQQIFGLPDMGEKRHHHQTPPQFMTELYNEITHQSRDRRKNPYNAKVIRSFIERDNSMSHFFYFNISGLDMSETVLEAQLRLYRMKTPPQELHHTFFTSPSLIIRVYQVLDELHIGIPDIQRLLSSNMVGTYSHGWEVFNVKEAVMDWVTGRRPNKGLLVTTTTLSQQTVDVRFARRNEHHNSKQPILVLFDDDAKMPTSSEFVDYRPGSPEYYKYKSELKDSFEEAAPGRRRRSLPTNSTGTAASSIDNIRENVTLNITNINSTNSIGECQRYELIVDFEKIGWSSLIIAPTNYAAYHCKGHCNFPLGPNLRPTNHATVQSIVHEFNFSPDVDKPCCVPTTLREINVLFFDENDNVVLKTYDDMVAESCGCL